MRLRLLLVPMLLLLLAALSSPLSPSLAAQPSAQPAAHADGSAGRNAAAVVIDTGAEVRKVCVRFDEPELTGEELLRRANVQATFAEYSIGMAVCSLCGVGCPSDDCFCESASTGRYWNYSRGAGAGWQRSDLGASSTTVRDGDVEGWAWGTEGTTPPWIGFESICVEVDAAPPAPTSSPAGPSAPNAAPSPSAASATRAPAPAAAEPSASPSATPSPAPEPAGPAGDPPPDGGAAPSEAEASREDGAVLTVRQDDRGSGLGGVLAFLGGAGALGAGAVAARRRLG